MYMSYSEPQFREMLDRYIQGTATPEEKKLLDEIQGRYALQTTPYYAAARLWVDAIIDPAETRLHISEALRAANENPEWKPFRTGVIQV